MTEPKRNPNPFIRMAQEAREIEEKKFPASSTTPSKADRKSKPGKATQGFGGTKVMRRSGRGG